MAELYRGRALQTAEWADFQNGNLLVDGGERPIQMLKSDGTGAPLLKNGDLGADIIRFGASEGVAEHTHVGQHVLFVLRGLGVVKYDGVDNSLYPGKCYLVESWVPHAIYADKEDALVLLVVGDDHRALDDPSRMDLTALGEQERLPDGSMPLYGGDVLDVIKNSGPVLPGGAYRD
jgi:quercetin dioxygenase-like cupin family protein